MASTMDHTSGTPLLLVGDAGGITIVEPSTPLRRLNYFDGKFLRAEDFNVEQSYLRQLVALSNQGLGPGVVYGYDTTRAAGDTIQVGPGLAIDPAGKVLLLQSTVTQSVQALIEATRKLAAKPADASGKTGGFSDCIEVAAPAPATVLQTSDLYVIAICAAEALCGLQDVYGVACQDACVTATDRPYRLDGIVLRAIPLQLVTPLPTSKAVDIGADRYLRSKVAHAWFADEQLRHPSAISRAGLLTELWCLGAGYAFDCCEVPLAVVARSGAATLFLDAWTVRRERIDAPARRYWQWKMRMRPSDVFLAQVLQFQCQLADLLSGIVVPGARGGDPCSAAHQAIGEAAQFVEQVRAGLASHRELGAAAANGAQPALLAMSLTGISDLGARLRTLLQSAATPSQPRDRVLIRGGIIELPPAGYLPVVSGGSVSVNDQVRALLGEGLDLRFCITSADYIAHAVEEAQHMDRVSLLQGLDDPNSKPQLDILVPDGHSVSGGTAQSAGLYDARLRFSAKETGGLVYQGAAREHTGDAGGTSLYLGLAGVSQAVIGKLQALSKALMTPASNAKARPVPLTPNLAGSAFMKKTGTLGSDTGIRIAREALLARSFTNAFGAGTAAPAAGAATPDNIDGAWLSVTTDKQIRALGVGGQTAVDLRIVLSSNPAAPVAIDVTFHGALSITTVSNSSTVPGVVFTATGVLNGMLAIGRLQENQAQQRVIEYLMTERFNWPVTLAYSGDADSGSVDVDLRLGPSMVLRLTRLHLGEVQITYRLALLVATGAAQVPAQLAELLLVADADVASPANVNHKYAASGLDLLQAALIVSEPDFARNAAALLFPAAPAAGDEPVIQAVRDWVAFTKRRQKQSQRDVAPPPPAPPRSYRVLSHRVDTADEAQGFAKEFGDPAQRAGLIKSLLALEQRAQHIPLVLKFTAGSVTSESDLVAAEKDWKTFNPGDQIYYGAAGAVGESDPKLQLGRLHTFLGAIAADSQEVAAATEDAIVPWPQEVVLDDADGIMVIVSVMKPVITEAIHVFAGNADMFGRLSALAKSGTADPSEWKRLLADLAKDLATASFTASPGMKVDDGKVLARFQQELPKQVIDQSLLLADHAAPANSDRPAAALKVVQDIDGTTKAPSFLMYQGTWFADTPSILLLQCHRPG